MNATTLTLEEQLGCAMVQFDGNDLQLDTGLVRRSMRWTGRGLVTSVLERRHGATWCLETDQDTVGADWLLPTSEGGNPPAELISLVGRPSDDEGFTSNHLALTAEMVYAEARLAVRFVAWVYPEAPGLRTQLFVRALDGFQWQTDLHRLETSSESLRIARLNRGMVRLDRLPCGLAQTRRRYIGCNGHLQHRNDTFTRLLEEHVAEAPIRALETCDWAGVASVELEDEALTMVKESNKRPNALSHDAGIFRCRPGIGLESLGWGVLPSEITADWTPAWASWCLAHGSDATSRERALKTMDRVRYPVRPRDMFIQANTWGSSTGNREHRDAAGEASVLKELECAKDLGVDLVQVDDGWQGDHYDRWAPCVERYPEGWGRVRARAEELGIRLGLWASVSPRNAISLEDLKRTFDEGGFSWYKLDFAILDSRKAIDEVMARARAFLLYTEHEARVNWDDTEGNHRFGTWFAREYGALYMANRKPVVPKTTVYRPHTMLRDLWEVARYANLTKILGPIQNIDRVDAELSDAACYGHAYCVAITLFALPTFFQELKFMDEAARAEIRPLLALHHRHREEIRRGITYPVGQRPDGASWTGFQNHREEDAAGLLLVFRELANESLSEDIALHVAAGRSMMFTDLLSGDTWTRAADDQGRVSFELPDAPSFCFLAYRFTS